MGIFLKGLSTNKQYRSKAKMWKTIVKKIEKRKKWAEENPEKAERARIKRVEKYLKKQAMAQIENQVKKHDDGVEYQSRGEHGNSEGVQIDV